MDPFMHDTKTALGKRPRVLLLRFPRKFGSAGLCCRERDQCTASPVSLADGLAVKGYLVPHT
eukprot:scaffold328887_cov57-Tisochrysis_lutea.AAC.1